MFEDGYYRKMSTLAALVDLKVAYNTVWRPMLLHKLVVQSNSSELKQAALETIHSTYPNPNRSTYTQTHAHTSDSREHGITAHSLKVT